MKRSSVVDLSDLAKKAEEISQLSAGISGESILWTAQMRSAVRGGKPLGGPRLEDSSD